MDLATARKIKANPKYQELISKRGSFAWRLAIIILVVYYTFIMIIAFDPSILGQSLSGGVTTIGIPVGIIIILIAFALTGIYVNKANNEFDDLSKSIQEDLKKEQIK